TVVTHELGHLLGFEHSDTGVMEAALAPGARVVPAALTGTSSVAVAGASAAGSFSPGVVSDTTTAVSRTAEPARVAQAGPSRAEAPVGAFVAAGRDLSLSSAAGMLQDGIGVLRSLPGVAQNAGQQSPLVLSVTATAPAALPAGPGRDFSSI